LEGDDVLQGLGGNDLICGGPATISFGGNDLICGGPATISSGVVPAATGF
jgi:hypothetical protein